MTYIVSKGMDIIFIIDTTKMYQYTVVHNKYGIGMEFWG